LSLASAAAEWFRIELKEFKPGALVYLRMQARAREFKCEYSLDNEAWTAAGAALDGQQLSTKVAGGFVGAYFGLYAFAPSPAKATFDWAAYQQLK